VVADIYEQQKEERKQERNKRKKRKGYGSAGE
jgi:hypothetical protein